MSMIQHILLTPDLFPQEIKAFLGKVHTLAYPRQGYTSNVAIVSCERGTYVVKHSPGEQFSNWLAQEYRILQALKNIPLPLPQPYHYMQRCLWSTRSVAGDGLFARHLFAGDRRNRTRSSNETTNTPRGWSRSGNAP